MRLNGTIHSLTLLAGISYHDCYFRLLEGCYFDSYNFTQFTNY